MGKTINKEAQLNIGPSFPLLVWVTFHNHGDIFFRITRMNCNVPQRTEILYQVLTYQRPLWKLDLISPSLNLKCSLDRVWNSDSHYYFQAMLKLKLDFVLFSMKNICLTSLSEILSVDTTMQAYVCVWMWAHIQTLSRDNTKYPHCIG